MQFSLKHELFSIRNNKKKKKRKKKEKEKKEFCPRITFLDAISLETWILKARERVKY